MAADGMSHEIPSEFTDEDRWLNLFSTKSFAVLGVGGVLTLGLYKFFGLFSISLVGGILGFLVTAFATGLTMIPKMGDDYLRGAGQKLDRLLLLWIVRKRNRCIYVKGYGKEE